MVQQQLGFMVENKTAWLEDARHHMRRLLRSGRDFVTSDTVWAICPPPNYINSKIMGSVFTNGEFESVGFTRSKRASSHGRHIQMFRLRNAG